MALSDRIRQLRAEKKVSQQRLAKKIKVHPAHLSRYERGLSSPSVDVIKRLCKAFGVSADYLIFEDGESIAKGSILDKDLLNQFQQVEQLDKDDKETVKSLISAFLAKRQIQNIVK